MINPKVSVLLPCMTLTSSNSANSFQRACSPWLYRPWSHQLLTCSMYVPKVSPLPKTLLILRTQPVPHLLLGSPSNAWRPQCVLPYGPPAGTPHSVTHCFRSFLNWLAPLASQSPPSLLFSYSTPYSAGVQQKPWWVICIQVEGWHMIKWQLKQPLLPGIEERARPQAN